MSTPVHRNTMTDSGEKDKELFADLYPDTDAEVCKKCPQDENLCGDCFDKFVVASATAKQNSGGHFNDLSTTPP